MKTPIQKLVGTCAALTGLAAVLALPVRAVPTISLTPSANSILVGNTATVTLSVSGITGGVGLGAWFTEFSYNGTILGINSQFDNLSIDPLWSVPGDVTFGTSLGLSFQYSLAGGGAVHADETSIEDVSTLQGLTSVNLATFTFTGLSAGTSSLQFTRVELSQADGLTTLAKYYAAEDTDHTTTSGFSPSGASITVLAPTPNGVPDTGVTFPLMLCIGFMFVTRRFQVRSR